MPLFAKISVEIEGEGVRDFAVGMIDNMTDLRVPLTTVAENIRKFEYGVFASEGAKLLGHQWGALAPSTVKARKRGWGYYKDRGKGREGPSRRILHWRLGLRDSLADKKHPNHIESISAQTLIFGTSIPHARFHVRRRKFLGLTSAFVKTEVIPPIALWLRAQDPRSGLRRRRARAGRATRPIAA